MRKARTIRPGFWSVAARRRLHVFQTVCPAALARNGAIAEWDRLQQRSTEPDVGEPLLPVGLDLHTLASHVLDGFGKWRVFLEEQGTFAQSNAQRLARLPGPEPRPLLVGLFLQRKTDHFLIEAGSGLYVLDHLHHLRDTAAEQLVPPISVLAFDSVRTWKM